jgi:hypothetical protein
LPDFSRENHSAVSLAHRPWEESSIRLSETPRPRCGVLPQAAN